MPGVSGPVVLDLDDRYAVVMSCDVLIIVWEGPPAAGDFARFERFVAEHEARNAGKLAVLVVVEPRNLRPPSPQARVALAALIDRHKQHITGVATVLLGSTVKHVVLRFVLSTMQLMASSVVAQTTSDSVSAAARWTQGRLPGIDAARLEHDCDEARRSLQARRG